MSDQPVNNLDHRPTSVLEAAMNALAGEAIEAETLLWVMTASDLLLPEVDQDDGETVALVIEEDDGVDYLALFTHIDQVPDMGDFTPSFAEVTGLEAMLALPEETGIAVNPGAEASFTVDPDNVAAFREHLADTGLIRLR